MSQYSSIELPAQEREQVRVGGLKKRVAAAVTLFGALCVALVAFNPAVLHAAKQALNYKFLVEGPNFSYETDCRGKIINSYQCVYGRPGKALDPEACVDPKTVDECFDPRPLCDDVTKCYVSTQCAESDEICNREMVRPDGFLNHPGFCSLCEVMSMAECLMHPCHCTLVDLVDRCITGKAEEACAAYTEAGCALRDCTHHEFLKTGGEGYHYLGGSNIIDQNWVDRTPDTQGKSSVGNGGGSYAQASTDAGGAAVANSAEDDAAALAAAQMSQAK